MERFAMKDLAGWKSSPRRRPLLIQGARQVGKTWLIKNFGRMNYNATAYINFLDDEAMVRQFDGELSPSRLLDAVTFYTGVDAKDPATLVVFDEIQECPRAITSLKAFAERRPETHLIAAGSLLGVALHQGTSFPVGKVDHLFIYPMTFDEFLIATGNEIMRNTLHEGDFSLVNSFTERYIEQLRRYYFIGGMPDAVQTYLDSNDLREVRAVHNRLLFDYEHDFSKYAPAALAEKIRLVWNSIPGQLARENKKFIYAAVRTGARARGYEEAIQWLVDAGLIIRVNRISKPGLPLASYAEKEAFKTYFLDVGLLGAANRLGPSVLVEGSELFSEFKGSLTENYVCQELVATGKVIPYYWSAENSSGEIDFVYDYDSQIVPIEVKASTNLQAKSLRLFVEKNHLERGLRLSLDGFKEQDWVVNLPLYGTGLLPDWFYDLEGQSKQPNVQ
ncbi:ATP-binding protein [Adlercreutzia sp. R7]|uniref:ATP-binding protein n=1 Tax=Adlercreutzia wanghongyangiae TaxID=3111451 RepID=A0ABU6IK32_9ACTN|nr:ATP-binding protein [Adlercreutzia sp. R7]